MHKIFKDLSALMNIPEVSFKKGSPPSSWRTPNGENRRCVSEHEEYLKHDYTKEILFLAIEMPATVPQ